MSNFTTIHFVRKDNVLLSNYLIKDCEAFKIRITIDKPNYHVEIFNVKTKEIKYSHTFTSLILAKRKVSELMRDRVKFDVFRSKSFLREE